jgi:phosphoglycolate phosphatase
VSRSRFPLILFDLDGTLVDSFADIASGIAEACRAIDVVASDAVLKLAARGVPLEDFYLAATGEAPGGPRWDRFGDAYRRHYLPGCVTHTRPYPGVVETLEALRRLAPRPVVGVATTKRSETAARVLDGTGLLALIDVYSGSDGIAHKPDPAVLRKVAARAEREVSAALMVGDTDRDILAARAAGCKCAAVTWGGFAREELSPLDPDWMLERMTDLLPLVIE